MEFHPDKCKVLRITKKRNQSLFPYYLRGHLLTTVPEEKYLGVKISSNLSWTPHIRDICKKANRTIGFLRRNLNIASTATKTKAYNSLVRPQVEYACEVWDPHTTTDVNYLEMVQRRAARYVSNRYHNRSSVTDMLQHLQWDSLAERRRRARLALFYKVVNGMVNVDPRDHLRPPARLSRGMNQAAYQIQSCRTEARKMSFFPRTIRDWNALPLQTVTAESLPLFRALSTA